MVDETQFLSNVTVEFLYSGTPRAAFCAFLTHGHVRELKFIQ